MLNTIGGSPTQHQSAGGGLRKRGARRPGYKTWRSDRIQAGFTGSDANGLLDVGHENLAVADATGLGRAADGVDRFLDQVVPDHDLDFHLGQKVDDVFGAAIQFRVPLLSPETFGFRDRDALQSDFLKRLFHLVELEWLDDGLYFFH